MALSSVEMSAGKYGMEAGGEVHNSPAPLLTSLAITLCLGGLLIWPLAVLGVPLLV